MNVVTATKRGNYRSSKSGRWFHYKSSWELAYMRWLDSNDTVIRWNYETVKIPYVRRGKDRVYHPDFTVDYEGGRWELVEIKPAEYVDHPQIRLKISAAIAWCSLNGRVYSLLTEKELIEKGVMTAAEIARSKRHAEARGGKAQPARKPKKVKPPKHTHEKSLELSKSREAREAASLLDGKHRLTKWEAGMAKDAWWRAVKPVFEHTQSKGAPRRVPVKAHESPVGESIHAVGYVIRRRKRPDDSATMPHGASAIPPRHFTRPLTENASWRILVRPGATFEGVVD
jgi:hypothetical protein